MCDKRPVIGHSARWVASYPSATSAPAAAFHIADRGRIAPGLRADLLLVNGRPDQDIRATRDIVAVYKGGNEVDRKGYYHPNKQKAE